MQLKLEGSKDNLVLNVSFNEKIFPVIKVWVKKRKINPSTEKNIVLADLDTIIAFASTLASLPRMNERITKQVLGLNQEIKFELLPNESLPNQWLINALIQLYRDELDTPDNLRPELRYLKREMLSRETKQLFLPLSTLEDCKKIVLKNPDSKSPVKVISMDSEEIIIEIDAALERIELYHLLKGLGQPNADFTQIKFYKLEQAIDAVEILATNAFDRLFYIYKSSYRDYCLYINAQYARDIYQTINSIKPSTPKETALPNANLLQIAIRCGDVSKVEKLINKNPNTLNSLTKDDLKALKQSNRLDAEKFEEYKELPYFLTSSHDKRSLLPPKPHVPRGSYVSILSLISKVNPNTSCLPSEWAVKMSEISLKAKTDSGELSISKLHEIREDIVADEAQKRFEPAYKRVFSTKEKNIVLATLTSLFPKNCQELLPNSEKLSSVLGVACYIIDLGREVQIKITENLSNPEEYRIYVQKLKNLGASIVRLTRSRFSPEIISCSIEIANYSLELLNKNVEAAYAHVPPNSRFVLESGELIKKSIERIIMPK